MSPATFSTEELRSRTQAHYNKYPFRFDQREIMEEKLHQRIMGRAILALPDAGPDAHATVLDVGCGACRVTHMVRSAGKGHAIGVDLSLETLRSATEHNPDPVANGDNMRLPIRSDVADLVISNGVIMVTPDARTSFGELARITRPGGTLVVSVYDKRSWYYPVYKYGGAVVRWLQRWIGDTGLKLTVFPFFHLATLLLMAIVTKPFWIPIEISWNLFHDQFTTPHCTFHTFEEVSEWADQEGLLCEEKSREAANQLITFKLRKPTAAA